MKSLQKIFIISLVSFYWTSNAVQGQNDTLTTVKTDSLYFESPSLFVCNIQFPKNYNSEKSLPLLISLHGGGGSYETFKKIWRQFEDPQFILATPQAPYKWLMDGKIGYDWANWPSKDLVAMQKAIKLTSSYIENLIRSLTAKYNINKVYLMGFSQGSIITQIAGINNHTLIEGIIILSGPEIDHPGKPEIVWPSEKEVRSANNLSVFIAHGTTDKIIDISLAIKSVKQYEKMGYEVSFFDFEGGHEINLNEMKTVEKWIYK